MINPFKAGRRQVAAVLAVGLGAAVAGATLPALPAHAVSTGVLINEVYGGGGNTGATFSNDFVELTNPTSSAIDLTGYKVTYYSSAGGSGGTCTLTGSIAARGTYLIQGAAGATPSTALPTPDATCTFNMSGTNGSVELVNAAGLVDLVGYGTATKREGTATPALTNSTSASRTSTTDTDNNAADFAVGAPTPQNSGTTTPTPTPTPTSTATPTASPTTPAPATPKTIAEIQGTGAATPLAGQVVTTRGVVTAAYPTGGFNGIYVQTPGTGGQPRTAGQASDGIFVYTGGAPTQQVGQCFDITATAAEYNGLTQLTKPTFTAVTECAAPVATPLSTVPVTDADKEPYEGMLVLPQGPYTITNNYDLNTYGQIGLAVGTEPLYTPTDVVDPAEAPAFEAEQKKKYITLDDGQSWNYMTNAAAKQSPLPYLSQASPMRTDSQVGFTKPVIMDFRFQWNYQPTAPVVGTNQAFLTTENDREATPPNVGGDVQMATFNILNYFTDLGQDEANCKPYTDMNGTPVGSNGCKVRGAYTPAAFADQQAKIVNAINTSGAEIVALMEVENSAAFGHDRDATLKHLVDELNAKGGSWAYAPSPVTVPTGEDMIRLAFIYNPKAVTPVGASEILSDGAFANARYPLAQKFKGANSTTEFVAIANHFKSKGSGYDDGTGQGLSNPARVEQAKALVNFANTRFAGQPVFLLGDFNAYSKEDPIEVITGAGYVETEKVFEPKATTYQFGGRLGSLDHIFANDIAMKTLVDRAGVWDINGDESVAMQYSRRHYNIVDYYTTEPYAASDHDPALVGIKLAKASTPITDKWNSLGGATGPVGAPVIDETCGIRDAGCFRHFAGGSIYDSASTDPHLVKGAIFDKWASMGWENSRLGYPTSDEICGLRDGGCVSIFQGGAIYWSPATGTHTNWGAIRDQYAAHGWENSQLGYPTSDEFCGLRDGGCAQRFQGGLIHWSPATGAHTVWGAIESRYAALGWETSRLGYPVSNEMCGLRDGGCWQAFQGGAIYWSPATGAWPVWGSIRAEWGVTGWENGRFGYPTGVEICNTAPGGALECRQGFERQWLGWSSVAGLR
ncbi:ExeM/NucH family extracellular endonuclease [Mariniluteicoccus flavus]